MIQNVCWLSHEVPFILSYFQKTCIFLTDIRKVRNFIKILPSGDELFREDAQTDRQTDMTKQIVAFRYFANSSKVLRDWEHMYVRKSFGILQVAHKEASYF